MAPRQRTFPFFRLCASGFFSRFSRLLLRLSFLWLYLTDLDVTDTIELMNSNLKSRSSSCCVAFGCSMRSRTNLLSKITMNRFPRDRFRRRQWEVAVRRKDWVSTPNSKLCSRHFVTGRKSDDPNHPDYIPSIFDYNSVSREKHERRMKSRRSKEKTPRDPSNVSSLCNTKPKATTSKKYKKQKLLASPEEAPTNETAEAWNSVLHLQPIESAASTSGVRVPPQSQHEATEPIDSSTETADSDGSTPKERPKIKSFQRKIARSPSPTANASEQRLSDPLKLCIVKMEIEDDGYDEEENYLTSVTTTPSPPSQINATFRDPKTIKIERNRELEPTIFKVASSIDYSESSSDSRESVETFFKSVAETVVQLPPHLIEETKVKISSLVYDMVIQAISEGCTNIQQLDL